LSIIKNIIKTVFTSEGAAAVAAETAGVTKAQTRLGQGTASAGRQFAAQSQGLGGLVAAYAGAAATIFALEAAFTALSQAAQAETIVKGTSALALEIGQSGPRIIASLQQISQGQLTLAETAQNANIALAAGFNTQQIERLTAVALGASRALGRDFTDSLQRVIRGSAKLEPELLDELGIFTRIDPAVRAYAQALNVSENNLTQFERRQAFVNAVIAEGERKFSAIDTSAASAQKSLEQLRVQVSNLGTGFLQFVGGVLGPFVNFFKNDAGNTLLLFGGILALVFGKGISIIGDFAKSGLTNMSNLANGLAAQAEKMKGTFGEITAASDTFNKSVKDRGGLLGGKGGTGSFAQGAGLTKDQISAAALARQNFVGGGATIGAMRDTDIKALKVAVNALTTAGKEQSLAVKDANLILDKYSAAAKQATLATRGFSAAAGVTRVAVTALSVGMNILNASLGIIFTVITVAQLAGTLFDRDFLSDITGYFKGLSDETANLTAGFLGLADAAGGASLTASLKLAGAGADDLEGLNDRLVSLNAEFTNLAQIRQKSLGPTNTLDRSTNPIQDQISDDFAKLSTDIFNKKGTSGVSDANFKIIQENLLKTLVINERIKEIEAQIAEERSNADPDTDFVNARIQERIELEAIVDATTKYAGGLDGVVGALSKASGISAGDIVRTLTDPKSAGSINILTEDLGLFNDLTDASVQKISFLGVKLNNINGKIDFNKLSEEEKQFVINTILLNKTLSDGEAAFAAGTTSSEKLAAQVSGAAAALKELKTSGLGSAAEIENVSARVEELNRNLRELQTAEKVLDGIQKAFSGALGKVDTAAFTGLISITGKLAKNTEQLKGNQQEYLRSVIDAGKALEDRQDTIGVGPVKSTDLGQAALNATELTLIEAGVTAQKAQVGLLLENYDTTLQILEAEKKKKAQLEQENKLLSAQNALAISIAQARNVDTVSKNSIASADRSLELSNAQLSNIRTSNDLELQRLNNVNQIDDIEAQIGLIKGSYNEAAAKASLQAVINQGKLLRGERELLELQRTPEATSGDVIAKRRELIELERKVLTDNYNNQKAAINAQGSNAEAALQAQKDSVARQTAAIDKEITFKIGAFTLQQRLFDTESANIRNKIQADIARLAREEEIIKQTRDLEIQKIEAAKAIANQDNGALVAQLKGYKTFADSTNAFNNGISLFATVIAELLGVAGNATAKTAIEKTAKDLPAQIITDINTTILTAAQNKVSQDAIFNKQIDQLQTIAELDLANKQAEILGLQANLVDTEKLRAAQKEGANTAQIAAIEQLQNAKKLLDLEIKRAEAQAGSEGGGRLYELLELQANFENSLFQLSGKTSDLNYELDIMKNTMNAVKDVIKSSVTQALVDLNASFFDTTDDIRTFGEKIQDAFYNIFKSIQETFFQKAIAEPIANFVTDAVSGLFGGGKETKGADNAKVIDGALLTTTAQSAGENPILAVAKEGNGFFARTLDSIKNTFSGIFGQGGFVSNLIGGVFGQEGIFAGALKGLGGIGTSIFSSLGNIIVNILSSIGSGGGGIIGSIASGIGSLFASGGTVHHMAQGGGVNSLRDRVPAMLEPGEFVLRKQAASAIGTPALQAMNAGGAVGGNVVVNIKNEGTPQDATASKPRFDGEKFVIDIITRDLSNNGPIRRSMRAGS
jgi:hypothetical protein